MRTILRAACAVLACAAVLSCGGGSSAPDTSALVQIPDAPGAYQSCSGPNATGWCWLQPQVVPREWQDFQFVDAEHGWAVGESGAIVASIDGGRSWHWQLTPLNEELSLVRFADGAHGWAFARGTRSVLETRDGGRTWEIVGEIPLGQPLRLFEGAVERFWVTTSGTLVASSNIRGTAVSEDAGRTWRVLSMRPVTDVGRSGTLWSLSALDGLWLSRDAGRSASLALECRNHCSIAAVDLADDSRLTVLTTVFQSGGTIGPFTRYASSDGGKTWSAASMVVPQASSTSEFFPIGPLVEGQVWAQSRGPLGPITGNGTSGATADSSPMPDPLVALWHSSDEGRTWNRATLPPVELDFNSLASPLDGTSLWIAAKNKGYVTLDAGVSWRTIDVAGETDAPSMLRRSGGVLLAAFGHWGLSQLRWYSSADGGAAWTALPGGQADATTALHTAVWFADARSGLSIGSDGAVRASDDGGRSWMQTSPELPASGPSASVWFDPNSHFTPDGTVWIVTGDGLQRSRDGGRTWEAAGLPADIGARTYRMQFVDGNHGWLTRISSPDPAVPAFLTTRYRTSDGGLTWASTGVPPGGTAFADAQTGVAMSIDNTLYRTEDAGTSWTPVANDGSKLPYPRIIYFRTPKVGWILPGQGLSLMKTIDGGRSWTLAATLPETGASMQNIAFADEDNGWIVGERGLVLRTNDGGASWQRQDSGTERLLTSVFPIDSDTAWIAGGRGTLLYTRTGGRTQ